MSVGSSTQTVKTSDFEQKYTRDKNGFYVRNQKPSSGTLNAKRIRENVRALVVEEAKASTKHT